LINGKAAMITLKCVEFTVSLITFLLVYFFSTTLAGFFRALVAKKMGDDTAQQAGFLTLNPFAHVDLLGLAFLCLTYFGWSKFVPINSHNIDGSIRSLGIKTGWRIPKLLCAYFSDSFVYFFIAFSSLIFLILLFGPEILFVAASMLSCPGRMSHLFIARTFHDHASLTIVIGFILIVLASLCIIIGILDSIINSCHLGLALLAERSPESAMHYGYIAILAPIILILCCAGKLRLIVTALMLYGGWFVARLLGLVG